MPKLNGRVARLERTLHVGRGRQQIEKRRQYLSEWFAERFSDSPYSEHRDALIETLCSDRPNPLYRMDIPTVLHGYPAHEYYFITWPQRDTGGPVVSIAIMPDKEEAPYGVDEGE